ncbi:MAG: hypothetical protein AAFP02_05690 [Bacteroidota bacterium]
MNLRNNFPILRCVAALLLMLSAACYPSSERYINRLEGTWTIQSEAVTVINLDGSIDAVSEAVPAGEIQLGSIQDDNFALEYQLVREDGTIEAGPNIFYVDQLNKRVHFLNYFCEGQPDCDLVATVEVNEGDQQIWNWFRRQGSGSHRKVRWELIR